MIIPIVISVSMLVIVLKEREYSINHDRPYHIAEQYIGKNQHRDHKELTRLLGIDPNQTSWCARFVEVMLSKGGYEGTHSLMARSYLQWGIKTDHPRIGDIVVFKDLTRSHKPEKGHVGFWMGEKDGKTYTLGGNEDDQVEIKGYSTRMVIGYRTF